MEFCPKCGCMLTDKNCSRCGHQTKSDIKLESSEKIEDYFKGVIINKGDEEIHPIVDAFCSKCQNNKAYFWTLQTRASDEAETKFFRCTKCRNTWRDYH